jgi:monoamine oxidase
LEGEDSIIALGYTATLINYLQNELAKTGRGKIVLNVPVTKVAYSTASGVTVRGARANTHIWCSHACACVHACVRACARACDRRCAEMVLTAMPPLPPQCQITAGGNTYKGKFAVITLPVGVLKAGSVAFEPALPNSKANALKYLGMGTLNKVMLAFPDSAEWTEENWIERLPLASDNNRWREFFSLRSVAGKPVIVAFNAGNAAVYPEGTTDEALVASAVAALRGMFGADNIADPVFSKVTRWHADPYSVGSYSIVRPGAKGTERTALAAPVNRLLYFAGEATSKVAATVQGAWLSGVDAAAKAAKDWP